jgi:hypothetical protein
LIQFDDSSKIIWLKHFNYCKSLDIERFDFWSAYPFLWKKRKIHPGEIAQIVIQNFSSSKTQMDLATTAVQKGSTVRERRPLEQGTRWDRPTGKMPFLRQRGRIFPQRLNELPWGFIIGQIRWRCAWAF